MSACAEIESQLQWQVSCRMRTGGIDLDRSRPRDAASLAEPACLHSPRYAVPGGIVPSTGTRCSALIAVEDDAANRRYESELVTDLHYADRPPARSRYYRESPAKLTKAAQQFRKEKTDCVDRTRGSDRSCGFSGHDQAELETHCLRSFAAIHAQRHYVLGNHCVYDLTKSGIPWALSGENESFYSFEPRWLPLP